MGRRSTSWVKQLVNHSTNPDNALTRLIHALPLPLPLLLGSLVVGCATLGTNHRAAYEAYSRKDYDKTIRLLAEADNLDSELLFILGDSHRTNRQYKEMLAAFDRSQLKGSEYSDLIENRVTTSRHQEIVALTGQSVAGNFQAVLQEFKTTDCLAESQDNYIQLRAFVYDTLNVHDKAIADYNTLIKHNYEDVELWKDRLIVLNIAVNALDTALELVQSKIQLYPLELRYHLTRIQLFEKLGRHDEVIAAIQDAEAKIPNRLELSMTTGVYYYNKQDYKTAAKYFEKIVAIDQYNPLAWYRLALCKFYRLDFESAQQAFDRVLSMDRDFLHTKNYYRVIALHLGREDDYAKHYGERLLEFDMSDLGKAEVSEHDLDRLLEDMEGPFFQAIQSLEAGRQRPVLPNGSAAPADTARSTEPAPAEAKLLEPAREGDPDDQPSPAENSAP